jgi:hypothetical protein
MAKSRPSGEGTAQTSFLERSRTEALPSSATFSKALSMSPLRQETRRLFPSADQSMVCKLFHPFTTRSRDLPVDVDWRWITPWLLEVTIARCKPSGDKLQLQGESICGGSVLFPVLTSNRNAFQISPLLMPYKQIVDGKREHCTLWMLMSSGLSEEFRRLPVRRRWMRVFQSRRAEE